jgi:histone H3/H4
MPQPSGKRDESLLPERVESEAFEESLYSSEAFVSFSSLTEKASMNAERTKRKLAAILNTDVNGYSRLMGEDEVATVRTLETYRIILFCHSE